MRAMAPWILFPLGAFAVVVLILNILERDVYAFGKPPESPTPVVDENDPVFRQILPDHVEHPCDTCGTCSHPVETIESLRILTVIDHDGWYRLFWAENDTYWFDDPAHLGEAFRNPTAETCRGTWTIRAKVKAPHACREIPDTIRLRYELFMSEDPIDLDPVPMKPVLEPPKTVPMMTYRYDDLPHRPPLLHFGWRLDAMEQGSLQ